MMALNPRDYEKMLEIFVSLEPVNPRPVEINELGRDTETTNLKSEIENCQRRLSIRNPSIPLIISTPSARRGSADKRQSLFDNEGNRSTNNFPRLSMYLAHSKRLSKVPQEIECNETNYKGILPNQCVLRIGEEENLCETIHSRNSNEERDFEFCKDDVISKNQRDIFNSLTIDCIQTGKLNHKNSFQLSKMKGLRSTHISEGDSSNTSVEDKLTNNNPFGGLPIICPQPDPTVNLKNDQSSGDATDSSSRPSLLSTEITTSSESFFDMSQSNTNNYSDDEIFRLNKEVTFTHDDINTPTVEMIPSEHQVKTKQPSELNKPQEIKTGEEQIKFYKTISNNLSVNSFSTKEIIKFYTRTGASSSQIIDKFQTAIMVCHTLKKKYNMAEDICCQIIEEIDKESLERPLEDHENILEIFNSWGEDSCHNRFIFQESRCMYKLFMNQPTFQDEMKYDIEINDTLWVKGKNSKWIRALCFIKGSNVYYSLKQGSKDSKDLCNLVNLKTIDFYTCSDMKRIKREFKAPTMEVIIFKDNKLDHKSNENLYLAAMNFQQKEKWTEAMRIGKFSINQLRNNYLEYQMCFPTGIRCQANSTATGGELHRTNESSSI